MATNIAVTEEKPDQFTVVALGADWARDARPSQLHVLVQFHKDSADTIRGRVSMGEGGIVPLPGDAEGDENLLATRKRLFLAFHAHVENRTMTDKVLTDLEARLDLALVEGLWKSLS
jgi:hypothetical protein